MARDKIEFEKDPDAVLDYLIEWGTWLDGDTLETQQWLPPGEPPNPPTVDSSTIENDVDVRVWVSAGELGQDYAFTNRVTTVGGRTEDRTVTFKMRNK